jgi:hypothetical protein
MLDTRLISIVARQDTNTRVIVRKEENKIIKYIKSYETMVDGIIGLWLRLRNTRAMIDWKHLHVKDFGMKI